jgi:hypothetical protein
MFADIIAALEVLHRLVANAGMPRVLDTKVIDEQGDGLDNTLVKAVLADDREVLLRLGKSATPSPRPRASFLEAHGVGAPRLYSSDDSVPRSWSSSPAALWPISLPTEPRATASGA